MLLVAALHLSWFYFPIFAAICFSDFCLRDSSYLFIARLRLISLQSIKKRASILYFSRVGVVFCLWVRNVSSSSHLLINKKASNEKTAIWIEISVCYHMASRITFSIWTAPIRPSAFSKLQLLQLMGVSWTSSTWQELVLAKTMQGQSVREETSKDDYQ